MADSVIQSIIFWVFAVLSVGSALAAMLNRSIVYSALCLIVVFLSIAGFFLLNNADFLAIAQIIIYAVGITIIMLFAIMFTGERPPMEKKVSATAKAGLTIVALYSLGLLLRAALYPFRTTLPSPGFIQVLQQKGSTEMLGAQLFNMYALPFEVASILLLVAMIGAIIIAKKSFAAHAAGDVHFEVDRQSRLTSEARKALEAQQALGLENERLETAEAIEEAEASENTAGASR